MAELGSIIGGAAGGAVVNIIIKGVDDFSDTYKKASKGADGLSKTLTKGFIGAGVAAAGLGAAVLGIALNAAKEVIPLQDMFNQMKEEIGQALAPTLISTFEALKPTIQTLATVFREQMLPALQLAFIAFGDLLRTLQDAGVLDVIIKVLGYVIQGLFTFVALVTKGIEVVVAFGYAVKEWIAGVLGGAAEQAQVQFNMIRVAIETVGLAFKQMKIIGLIAWESLKLGAATMANFVIKAFENLANKVIGALNAMIGVYNTIAGTLGRKTINTLGGVNFSGALFDTSAMEANLGSLVSQGIATQRQINVNIETLTGLNPEEIAAALRTKLNDLVSI